MAATGKRRGGAENFGPQAANRWPNDNGPDTYDEVYYSGTTRALPEPLAACE